MKYKMYEVNIEKHWSSVFYKDEHGFLRCVNDEKYYPKTNCSWFGEKENPKTGTVDYHVHGRYKESYLPDGIRYRDSGPEKIQVPMIRMLKKDLKEYLKQHVPCVQEYLDADSDFRDFNIFIVKKEDIEPDTYDIGLFGYSAKGTKEL